uniref:Uncharacterized protein LOC113796177 n=1 Tax=Dermatophagoides pteronyssinus TaxID=6956 RepID=A0A6P6YB67_DERPT|nr:uncharacterized protein LOC113796177 [Dermatophagoides pteronyssinus]
MVKKNEINITEDLGNEEFENKYVHETYNVIAKKFSGTRHSTWPRVSHFIQTELSSAGLLIADIGCGNEFTKGNILNVPIGTNAANCCICIATLHHLSSRTRRMAAMKELVRITQHNCKILIYVWAMEQKENSIANNTDKLYYFIEATLNNPKLDDDTLCAALSACSALVLNAKHNFKPLVSKYVLSDIIIKFDSTFQAFILDFIGILQNGIQVATNELKSPDCDNPDYFIKLVCSCYYAIQTVCYANVLPSNQEFFDIPEINNLIMLALSSIVVVLGLRNVEDDALCFIASLLQDLVLKNKRKFIPVLHQSNILVLLNNVASQRKSKELRDKVIAFNDTLNQRL